MANEYVVNKGDLEYVADAIKEKTGTSEKLVFPSDFVKKIDSIESAGNANEIIDGLLQGSFRGVIYNDRVTTLQNYALYQKSGVFEVNFPNVTRVNEAAFRYSGLTKADMPSLSVAVQYAFANCALTDIYLPKLSRINLNVFSSCKALVTARFDSVLNIDSSSFSGCTSLKHFIINTQSICNLLSTSAFTNTPIANGTGFIYVPDDLVEDYKAETNWVTYASQIRPLSFYGFVPFNISTEYETYNGKVKEGTIWSEWCEERNIEVGQTAWINQYGYVYNYLIGYYLADKNGDKVLWASEILEGSYFEYKQGVTFNISIQYGPDEYFTANDTVPYGTTWGEWCDDYNSKLDPGFIENMGLMWINDSGYVWNNAYSSFVKDSNGNKVLWDSEIVAGNYGS